MAEVPGSSPSEQHFASQCLRQISFKELTPALYIMDSSIANAVKNIITGN